MITSNENHLKQFIFAGITLGVIGTILYLAFQVIKPFLGILVTAGIFTIFMNPLFGKFKSQTKKLRVSALLTVFSLLLFIVIPLGLLISSLFAEVGSVSRSLQANPERINSFQGVIDNQIRLWQIPVSLNEFNVNEQVYQSLSFLARNLGVVALQSGGLILNLFFALITVYFLLINQKQIFAYITHLNLFPKQYLKRIKSRIIEIVNGTVRGYLLVVALQLVVGIIGFVLFQVPAAILLGSLYGISSLLPVIGGFLLWVPVVVWQVAVGNTASAIILSIWFLLLSFIVENIVAPKIIGESTKLHQLFVMFSVFGGIQYFGLLGMVLGPVVIALTFVALTILKEAVTTDSIKLMKAANPDPKAH
jgi:predicted PurR-regulated permease PerM